MNLINQGGDTCILNRSLCVLATWEVRELCQVDSFQFTGLENLVELEMVLEALLVLQIQRIAVAVHGVVASCAVTPTTCYDCSVFREAPFRGGTVALGAFALPLCSFRSLFCSCRSC